MRHRRMSAAAVALLATALASATMAPAWGAARPPKPSFVQPGSYRAEPVNTPLGFAVADFDGDTHLDLASAGVFSANPQSTTPRGVPVQPGDGAGHLGETTLTLLPSKTGLEASIAIDTADLDADGDPDIVVSTLDLVFDGTQTVVVYRMRVLDNQGDGSFTVLRGFRLPSEVDHLVLADFTGDGTTDLAYATDAPEGSTLWTAKGRGDGTFAWPVAITETEQLTISTLETADVDNDQSPDLVYGKGCVVAQLNNGDGTFGNPICNPLRNYPQTVAVADLDARRLQRRRHRRPCRHHLCRHPGLQQPRQRPVPFTVHDVGPDALRRRRGDLREVHQRQPARPRYVHQQQPARVRVGSQQHTLTHCSSESGAGDGE